MKKGYVYILSNVSDNVLYIGVTNDLIRRIYEHRNHLIPGFTDRYNVTKVLYFEEYNSIEDAIAREKQLKHWSRSKKIDLIRRFNEKFDDLYDLVMQ